MGRSYFDPLAPESPPPRYETDVHDVEQPEFLGRPYKTERERNNGPGHRRRTRRQRRRPPLYSYQGTRVDFYA